MEPIPIGGENKIWGRLGDPDKMADVLEPVVELYRPGEDEGKEDERPILSYINFSPRKEEPKREEALRVLSNISHVVRERIDSRRCGKTRPYFPNCISCPRYVADLKRSKFTVSPPGRGWDCHRTWESVLFGSIPVVLHSAAMAGLYRQGPVMVVEDWSQVTRERLLGHRVATASRDVVMAEYWLDRIKERVEEWRAAREYRWP